MAFDIPAGVGPSSPSLTSVLIGLGSQLGSQFIASRFQGGPGQDGMGEQLPAVQEPIVVDVQGRLGSSNGCGCKPTVPDFIRTAGDPCSPRPTTRTILDSNGCKQTIPVWAPARKKPRMNPLNIRAARRATRRLSGMGRALKGARKAVNKVARELK